MEEYKLSIDEDGVVHGSADSGPESLVNKIAEMLKSPDVNVAYVQRLIAMEIANLVLEMAEGCVETRSYVDRIRALRELGRQVETLR
jgi:hypothetical protein